MLKELPELIAKSQTINYIGKIENVTGMAMEASANNSRIGDLVLMYNEKQKREIPAEVVGFHGDKVQLMAYENLSGIGSGSFVRNTGRRLKIPVGEFVVLSFTTVMFLSPFFAVVPASVSFLIVPVAVNFSSLSMVVV